MAPGGDLTIIGANMDPPIHRHPILAVVTWHKINLIIPRLCMPQLERH